MNKNIMWIIVVVVIVIGGGIFVANQQSKKAQEAKMMQEKDAMKAKEDAAMKQKEKDADKGTGEDAMMKKNEEIMMMVQQNTTSKKATLADVSRGTGTGKAFVLRKGGKLYFTATANLSDPKDGTFYEGWLVKVGSNPPQFIDTGKLTKQKDGSFEVSYSSNNSYEEYDKVVITWEQVDDQKPEKHILEGLAQ